MAENPKYNDRGFRWEYTSPGDEKNVSTFKYDKEEPLTAEGKGFKDDITAGPKADILFGAGGDDVLKGLGGDDTLRGGEGSDRLEGGDGDDDIQGVEPGKPTPGEKDILIGGAGVDRFRLGDVGSVFYQGDGYAVIDDWNGDNDFIVLPGDPVNKIFNGKEYSIRQVNQEGDPNIADTGIFYGSDLIAVTKDSTTLTDFARFKFLETPAKAVKLEGGNDPDLLTGGGGDDVLVGQGADDELTGNLGNDSLDGGTGRDVLIGSGSNRPANDTEKDVLKGGAGADIFVLGDKDGVFYLGDGYATITDFDPSGDGQDKFRVSPIAGDFDNYKVVTGAGVVIPDAKAEIYYTGNGLNDLIAVVTNTDDVTPGEFGDFVF